MKCSYNQSNLIWQDLNQALSKERGCFVDKVTYNATKFQLEALMHISATCEQEINHKCNVNALTNNAFWNDRHGREIKYWNGDKVGCPQKLRALRKS